MVSAIEEELKALKLRNRFLERKWAEAEKHIADSQIERNEARKELEMELRWRWAIQEGLDEEHGHDDYGGSPEGILSKFRHLQDEIKQLKKQIAQLEGQVSAARMDAFMERSR